MGNVLKNLGDRITANARKEEEEQRNREARLRELEEAQQQNRSIFPHPIKAVQNKREAAALRKEIEKYKDAKKSRAVIIGCSIFIVLCFAVLAILGLGDKDNDNPQGEPSFVAESTVSPTEAPADPTQELAPTTTAEPTSVPTDPPVEAPSAEPTPDENETIPAETESPETPDPTMAPPTPVPTDAVPPTQPPPSANEITISDIEVEYRSGYAHADTTSHLLGQNEVATITISANRKVITEDDILLVYDEGILRVQMTSKSDHELQYSVSGIKPGSSEFTVFASYDLLPYLDEDLSDLEDIDINVVSVTIQQLDAIEGRVVFVTPTGDKYHFSSACAGANAIATTYHDVAAYEYEPCGRCAS